MTFNELKHYRCRMLEYGEMHKGDVMENSLSEAGTRKM